MLAEAGASRITGERAAKDALAAQLAAATELVDELEAAVAQAEAKHGTASRQLGHMLLLQTVVAGVIAAVCIAS